MNAYKNKLKLRMVFSSVMSVVMLVLMIMENKGFFNASDIVLKEDFFRGFINGMSLAVIFTSIINCIRYISMLKNKEKLKKYYIRENDELKNQIVSDVGKNEYYFLVYGLAIGIVIGGYINIYMFWSFYIALMYYVVVRSVLAFVYKFRYKTYMNSDNDEI
ncbi:MAG: hypothetical protein K2G63_06200 [Oscillospiraceae bacterium]|nr:hypothetical protein [Oscillospiraceae bacterium]